MTGYAPIRLVVAGVLSVLPWAPAAAQRDSSVPSPGRAALEQRVRKRVAVVVQSRLGLDDAAMRRLEATSRAYAPEYSRLAQQERDTRRTMRAELMAARAANQQRVSEGIDRLLAIQRQRLELVAREQRELAGFLTPVQRAKYLVLQTRIRRRADALREGGEGGRHGTDLRRR